MNKNIGEFKTENVEEKTNKMDGDKANNPKSANGIFSLLLENVVVKNELLSWKLLKIYLFD